MTHGGSRLQAPGVRRASSLALLFALFVACGDIQEARSPEPEARSPQAAAQKPTAAQFDSSRAYGHLREVVGIGPRPAGSPGIERTRTYITEQLAAVGVQVTRQSFTAKTPIGEIPMANLIAVIPGQRQERIAIAGHYDTKRFQEFRFVGANDGGSSTAFLIEMARVLKHRSNPFTMELIFFDGEEATLRDWSGNDHTYGSQHYVDAARKAGVLSRLKALVLVDMIGEPSPRFLRESYSTGWLTDIIWSTAQRMGHGAAFLDASGAVEDDHIPFLNAGVPATDIIDLDYPAWHTAADTLDRTSAKSLQIVGDVILASLPAIEKRLAR